MWVDTTLVNCEGASAAAFVLQTHKAPAAPVACCRGDRREPRTIDTPRPSPSARLAPHKANAYKRKASLHLIDIHWPTAFWTSILWGIQIGLRPFGQALLIDAHWPTAFWTSILWGIQIGLRPFGQAFFGGFKLAYGLLDKHSLGDSNWPTAFWTSISRVFI